MSNMQRISYLIDRFWDNTATVEERRELLDCLEKQNTALKDRMETEFLLLQKEFSNPQLSKTRSVELFETVLKTAGINDSKPQPTIWHKIKPLTQFSAAALILFFMSWSVYHFFATPPAISIQDNQSASVSDTVYYQNNGSHEQIITLEDSSIVTLYPGSTLSYCSPFGAHARDLELSGQARFDVAKDAQRPFTVLANGYTTTALGTIFVIDTKEEDQVRVHLISGKVVVRSTKESRLQLAETFLHPGDELSINPIKGTWALHNDASDREFSQQLASVQPKHTNNEDYIVFNKTPLDQVFDQIGKKYGYKIDTQGAELNNLSFTGSFKQSDPLFTIMDLICNMNDLTYRKEDNKLQITNK